MSLAGAAADEDDGTVLAAEYALGVLEGAERTAAERRYVADPSFAREADAWQARFAELTAAIAPVTPPARVWTAVAGAIARLDRSADLERRLRRSVRIWRGVAAGATVLAAALATAVVWPRSPAPVPPVPPVLTARLAASTGGPAVFVAFYDPARRALVLTPAAVTTRTGRSPELWLIPAGGKPIALGVAAFASSVQLIPAMDASGVRSGVLAVSIEPVGGSPTGQPTGPVVATGRLAKL